MAARCSTYFAAGRFQHRFQINRILPRVAAAAFQLNCLGRHAPLDQQLADQRRFAGAGVRPGLVAGGDEHTGAFAGAVELNGLVHPIDRVLQFDILARRDWAFHRPTKNDDAGAFGYASERLRGKPVLQSTVETAGNPWHRGQPQQGE